MLLQGCHTLALPGFPKTVLFVLSLMNVNNENFHEKNECKVVFKVSNIILQSTNFLNIGKVM